MPHVALAHRGPTPQRERRVRNQVPVCGNGIRSLATLDVTLTEKRKPARDSKGEKKDPGERSGQHGIRTHLWEPLGCPPVVRAPSLPLFPTSLPTFGTGHSSIPQAQGYLVSQASEHCYIFLVQRALSRVNMQMRLSDPWCGHPRPVLLPLPKAGQLCSPESAHSSREQCIKAVLLLSRRLSSIRSSQPDSQSLTKEQAPHSGSFLRFKGGIGHFKPDVETI